MSLSLRPASIPGHPTRELARAATSADGRRWPAGTKLSLLFGGTGGQAATIAGERVTF